MTRQQSFTSVHMSSPEGKEISSKTVGTECAHISLNLINLIERYEQDPCQTREQQARKILKFMNARKPEGARTWYPGRNLRTIEAALDDGYSVEELMDLVDGVATIIEQGDSSVRWWAPGSLFGPKSGERWAAEVNELRNRQAKATKLAAELEAQKTKQEPIENLKSDWAKRKMRELVSAGLVNGRPKVL